ncbi:MAG: DUF882 domain-containing protein [Myxococcales bacterium]
MRSPRYLALLLWEVLMNTKWIAAVLAALFVGGPATAEPAPSRYGNHDGPAHARSPNGPAKRQAQSRTARVTEAHGRPKAPAALISRDALPSLPHPSAEPPRKQAEARGAKPCTKPTISVQGLGEDETLTFATCTGLAPLAVERLSVLLRAGGVPRPKASAAALARIPGSDLAPGIKRVRPELVDRLEQVAEHFAKRGRVKFVLVSGYRPGGAGSYHASARAIDFRIEGVKNESLVAFCKTLPDTGCGFYPNSHFVHLDARDRKAGHVAWIDASGPGEAPRYVDSWPPPGSLRTGRASRVRTILYLDRELPSPQEDDHPALLASEEAPDGVLD